MAKLEGGPSLLNQLLYGLGSPPTDEFDITARRRIFATSGVVAVPASGSATLSASAALQDTLQSRDGLLFEVFAGIVAASDTTGHLQLVDASLMLSNFSVSTPLPFFPLSVPQPTTLFPRATLSLLFTLPRL